MAILGYTKLEAVNIISQAAGGERYAALDTGGTSMAGDIEYYLDIWDREIQSWGWPENTDFRRPYTPTGSPLKVQVASDTLFVRSSMDAESRRYTLRGDYVYDTETRSDEFSSATVIYLDTVKKLSFENLSPTTKTLIVQFAKMNYQIHRKGDPVLAQFHAQQAALFDMMAARVQPLGRSFINPSPVLSGMMRSSQPNA